jgi:hypothetical protein
MLNKPNTNHNKKNATVLQDMGNKRLYFLFSQFVLMASWAKLVNIKLSFSSPFSTSTAKWSTSDIQAPPPSKTVLIFILFQLPVEIALFFSTLFNFCFTSLRFKFNNT